jgi:hypothetical protein
MALKSHDATRSHSSNHPAGDPPVAESIRAQLDALLNSPQFRNSKRSLSLLKFVVEETIEGRAGQLKERVVGTEVFGRDPSYETTHDPIVRNAAIEVRKRLAQYYMEADRTPGVRIELPPGSYVPEFSIETQAPIQEVAPASPTVEIPVRKELDRKLLFTIIGLACLVIVAFAGWASVGRTTAFDRFWGPVFQKHSTVQVCVGEPGSLFRFQGPRQAELSALLKKAQRDGQASPNAVTLTSQEVDAVESRFLYRRDALVMAQLAAMLTVRQIPYRLRADSDAPYSELRGNPLILVGGFDAQRQMNLRPVLRFGFRREIVDGVDYKYVFDRQNPQKKEWRFRYSDSAALGPADYALITKTLVSATERPVISIVGATDFSTLAAGEFVTNPGSLNEALRIAPSGWEQKNLQIVVQTRVIQGVPGPTSAVAIHAW